MPQNLVYDLIKQAKELGVTSICLSGGEPLLYPKVYEIINAIITNDMVPFLSTNGSLLDESMVLSLFKSGLSSIQVSLDSSIPDIHHDMTQTKNTFNKVIDGIKLLKSKNMYVKINSVITIDNYSTIDQHIDALAKLNVDEIRLTWENAISCEKIVKHPNRTLNLELIKDLKEVVLNKQNKYKHCKILFSKSPLETWTNPQDIITCGNLMKAMVILPTGNVSICEMIQNDPTLVYGNVYG
ncbi:MoaA/NifB/PqqE/SkfB family radical SAM enzyme [Clostridium beijerinckii]|uniref:MoaA/NifB/PqqE/SkfB family radical SAM enzyme n=1 Tax=Clostridium beijerinckii TaxID=1520 RepID=A0AAX0B0W6_CLOBE|nr:MoaA/NifB/PqqE/SkfB family radical SAM enzyme [Clostridium beijerinckii]